MSFVLSPQDPEFYSEYSERQSAFDEAAAHARTFVENALGDVGLIPHAVTARAKDPSSLLEKLRRREYADPASDITDLVGVRVITRYRDEVDHCAAALRNRLEVDDTRSVDKRSQLDLREFASAPHNPGALDPETVTLIIDLRKSLTGKGLDNGPHTIRWHLNQHHGVVVSLASIWRQLNAAGLITPGQQFKVSFGAVLFDSGLTKTCGCRRPRLQRPNVSVRNRS